VSEIENINSNKATGIVTSIIGTRMMNRTTRIHVLLNGCEIAVRREKNHGMARNRRPPIALSPGLIKRKWGHPAQPAYPFMTTARNRRSQSTIHRATLQRLVEAEVSSVTLWTSMAVAILAVNSHGT